MEEVCSTRNINHLCPVKQGYSWNMTTRQEAKQLEKQKQTEKVIGSEVKEII